MASHDHGSDQMVLRTPCQLDQCVVVMKSKEKENGSIIYYNRCL